MRRILLTLSLSLALAGCTMGDVEPQRRHAPVMRSMPDLFDCLRVNRLALVSALPPVTVHLCRVGALRAHSSPPPARPIGGEARQGDVRRHPRYDPSSLSCQDLSTRRASQPTAT